MSILIVTPAYGGLVTLPYFNSCLLLQEELLREGIDHSWLTTSNESLITRGRNTSASKFLETDFERLLFIDADIEFSPEDVSKLWNLDVDVCCGAYSMKRKDSPVSAWKDGKLVKLEDFNEPTPVDFAGTGFLMIKRQVFDRMKLEHPEWERRDGEVWAFFQDDGCDLSEDYFFCQEWRKMGGEIILDPSIKLGHWGTFRYG